MMNLVLKPLNSSLICLSRNIKNSKNLSNISRDAPKQNFLVSQNVDLLRNTFKDSKSINAVFELVNTHNKIMNQNHIIQALRTIFMVQRRGNSGMTTAQILNHPDFERLCTQLQYHAGAIEINETIEALKVMSFVGVTSDSTIYQILLQLLRHNINQLSLQQIVFLDFLLSKTKSCPLVDALRIALPIVYDIQLPMKLDKSNISNLSEHLHFVSKKNISEQSITLIVNSLMKMKHFNAKTSVSIIWSICDMPANEFFEPLLTAALESLLADARGIAFHDLETVITKLLIRYSTKMPFYYNELLFDYAAQIAISEDLGFETATHLLKKFLRINHVSNDLLNYISKKCHQNPDLIEYGDPILTNAVICGCAMTDFRPKYYDTIKERFLKIKNFDLFQHKDIHPIRLQTALCVLDIYIPEIMEQYLNEENLVRLFKRKYMLDFENVLLISQAIKTFRPEFSSYLPSDYFLSRVKKQIKVVSDFPLEGSLHNVFGGHTYVKTQASTKMLHHIDHVILIKKGGIPSALNPEDPCYVEDIQCQSISQITLIMVLNHIHYTINRHQLKGSSSLMLKTLEAQGYSIVPICLESWTSLPEFEKLPYIMEEIKTNSEYFKRAYDVS